MEIQLKIAIMTHEVTKVQDSNKSNNLQIQIDSKIYSNKTHLTEISNYFNNHFVKITTNNSNETNGITFNINDETISHQSLCLRKTNLK